MNVFRMPSYLTSPVVRLGLPPFNVRSLGKRALLFAVIEFFQLYEANWMLGEHHQRNIFHQLGLLQLSR